jgi:hypothetical protein
MNIRYFISPLLILSLASCKGPEVKELVAAKKDLEKSVRSVLDSSILIEGRFQEINYSGNNSYELYVRVNDSLFVFKTALRLDSVEIGLLKKQGNNIKLAYRTGSALIP